MNADMLIYLLIMIVIGLYGLGLLQTRQDAVEYRQSRETHRDEDGKFESTETDFER